MLLTVNVITAAAFMFLVVLSVLSVFVMSKDKDDYWILDTGYYM